MRIAFILQGYPWTPTGGARVVYEYANQLVARGHEVTVVHPRRLPNWSSPPPGGLYRRLRRMAGHLRNLILAPRVEWQPIDNRVRMQYVPEALPRHVPDGDAVVATWWPTAELVLQYPPSKGHKFYLIQHYETWDGAQERLEATWQAPLSKVVISSWLYDKGLELGVLPEEMTYIPNGIDHARFRLLRPIETRPRRIVMMHSRQEWKGSRDGVDALELARREFPTLRAVLFGTRRRPQWLPGWIDYSLNPPQRVLIEGLYNGSSVCLCPSWKEGWCLPPMEAMACGCAVVATDNGGIREYAKDEVTALLSPPKYPEALAKNLLRLLQDEGLRIRLAEAGHQRIQEFSWARSADLLERVLRQHTGD